MYSSIIATIAIIFTIINLWLLNEHNKKSFRPYILINTDIDSTVSFIEIYLINKGVGPAIITDFEFTYKGQEIDSSNHNQIVSTIEENAQRIAQERGITNFTLNRKIHQITPEREVLAAGDRQLFLKVTCPHYIICQDLMTEIDIVCTYESIYEQKHKVNYISSS